VFLLSLNRHDELYSVFQRIARVNRVPFEVDLLKNATTATTAADGLETPSTMWFLKQKSIATNLAIMALIWLASGFNYFLITFLVNTFS